MAEQDSAFSVRWQNPFARVPHWMLTIRDKDGNSLSPQAFKVYVALATFADNETLRCFPSQEKIAERADMALRTAQRYIKELVDFGCITYRKKDVENSKWKVNEYLLMSENPSTANLKTFEDSKELVEELETIQKDVDYETVDLGLTANGRKRSLNNEIWDGFVEIIGSAPSDERNKGKWNQNIKRLVDIYKNENIEPQNFKLYTMTACGAYINLYGDKIALNPKSLADNWENIKPKSYNQAKLRRLEREQRMQYIADGGLPEGLVLDNNGMIVVNE